MSLFGRDAEPPWQLQALTERYVVQGSVDPDEQSSAGMFLRAQFKEAPLTPLRLGSPQVRAVAGGGAGPAPAAPWTFAFGSALAVLVPRDERSCAHALGAAGKPSGPVVAYVGPFRVAGTFLGSLSTAAQQPSFVIGEAQITGGDATIAPAPLAVVFTNLLHALEAG